MSEPSGPPSDDPPGVAPPPPAGAPPPYVPPGSGYPPPAPGSWSGPGAAVPPDRRPTDGFAIAALVFGIIGGILFGIVFGIVGLVRTKGGRRKGRGLAIAGLVLSLLWSILIVAIVAIVIASQPTRDASGQVTDAGRESFADVRVGDCVSDMQSGGVEFSVDVVPCGQPHEGQVFARFDLPPGAYPGDDQMAAQAEAGCNERIPDQLRNSPESADLSLFQFSPRAAGWSDGDREVICAVVSDSPMTASLPGLER